MKLIAITLSTLKAAQGARLLYLRAKIDQGE